MLRIRHALLPLLLALSALPATAAPIRITGRVLHPPKEVQVELRPWAGDYAEALRRLKGEPPPPLASVKARPDGSFALQVPDSGFYSVMGRAEGHVAMERFVRFVVEEAEVPPVELKAASPLEVKAVGADGQPLAGVTIQALPLEESGEWRAAERRAVTDAEGRAVFLRAEGEALTLVVTTPGRYATASTGPAGSPQTIRFPAQPARAVEFRYPSGKPAAGALVRLARRGWPYGLTGEDGKLPLPVPLKHQIGFFAEDSKGLRVEAAMTQESAAFTLLPPAMVSGRVLDASSREPIAGALVWNGGMAWTRTGPGGTFEIRAPSGERGQLEASGAGRMAYLQRWERDRNAAVTFLLEAAAPISGQVVDEAGRPVEGARITTVVNPGESRYVRMEERSSSSGPDGRFSLPKLPAGRLHAVEASRDGFAPARQLADSTAPVRLVLRRGALAFGRIVDEEGRPVAGARVSLAAMGEEGPPAAYKPFKTAADPEGRFRFAHLSPGRFNLRAESPGFASAYFEGVLVPEQEPEVDLGEVRLLAGGAIEGLVTDERGRPVEQAWIDLSPSGEDFLIAAAAMSGRQPATTGADGRFRIEDLPRGVRFDVDVEHDELQHEMLLGVEVPTAQPLRIRLSRPRTLSGRVVDERGAPVAGAQVRSSVTTRSPDGSTSVSSGESTSTDPEGRFRLSRVSPGTVEVQASAPGHRSREVPVQVPEDGEAEPVEILLEAGTSLEGLVLDSQGLPAPRAQVQAWIRNGDQATSRMDSSDEEGRYEIVDLVPGSVEVVASLFPQRRSTRATVEIQPGRNRFDLKFPTGVEVSGRVVDGRGEPLPGASLSLEPLQPGLAAPPLQATSSSDGSFVLADVADGQYRLTAARSGFGHATHPGEIRVDGEPVGGIELQLSPGAVIRGRVLGARPEEARSVTVHAFSEATGIPLMAAMSPGPAYRIDDVAPGEWIVSAQIPPDVAVQETVEVTAGAEEISIDLELPAGFTLSGRVLLDREPLAGAGVMAFAQAIGTQRGGRTGQDGAFRLERLPAESYVLLVEVPQGAVDFRTLEIGGDLEVTVEISTGAVEGRVLSPAGLPVPDAVVVLEREVPGLESEGPTSGATIDERGAFQIRRLPAGTYNLRVEADGFAPFESRVVVAPGGTVHLDIALGVSP